MLTDTCICTRHDAWLGDVGLSCNAQIEEQFVARVFRRCTSRLRRQQKMEMTSPVFSTAGQRNAETKAPTVATMQFPMERKFGSLDSLPHPNDVR